MDEASTARQVTLDGYTSSILSSDAAAVSGIVDRLKWWGGQPHIAFVQPDRDLHERASLPLPLILEADVQVTVGTERSCTSCGRPLSEGRSGTICWSCQGEPPFSSCIQNPATKCSIENCPYPEYKQRSCDHNHLVYLAATDRIKVGITRAGRARWRWAEQGASHALPIAEAENRKLAGIIERAIAKKVGLATRTHYRWYQLMDDVRRRLAEAACAARDVIPQRIANRFLWRDRETSSIATEVIDVPAVWIEGGTHTLPRRLGTIQPGQSREGTIVASRGPFIATDDFLVNTREVAGYQVTIEANSPFVDTFDSAEEDPVEIQRGSDVPGDASVMGRLAHPSKTAGEDDEDSRREGENELEINAAEFF